MRFIVIVPLVVAISFIILDNHFIYEVIIKSESYLLLREKVRSLKSKSGLKYQTKNNSKDSLDNDSEESLFPRMEEISAEAYLDTLKIISLVGSNRLKKIENFLKVYRNSSKQSNTVILGDFIHELSISQIDTLFIPFTSNEYCYDFAQTLWCQISSLSWFIYPAIVVEFDDYPHQLSEDAYKSIKQKFITVEGSNNTLINVPILNPDAQPQNYYLFSFENQIFVYPLNDVLNS